MKKKINTKNYCIKILLITIIPLIVSGIVQAVEKREMSSAYPQEYIELAGFEDEMDIPESLEPEESSQPPESEDWEESDEPVETGEPEESQNQMETDEPGESSEPIESDDHFTDPDMDEDESDSLESESSETEEIEEAMTPSDNLREAGIFAFSADAEDLPGTGDNPYLIQSEEDLARLAGLVNNRSVDENQNLYSELYYKLTSDLNLSTYNQWMPIGIYTENTIDILTNLAVAGRANYRRPFKGVFDGAGYRISNLRTGVAYNTTYGYTRGLFGLLEGAQIKNLTISQAVINGRGSSGILAGYSMGEVLIENCHTSGTVTTSGSFAGTGGLIGYLVMEDTDIKPMIRDSSADVTISSSLETGKTGGLIGYVRSGNESFTNANRASWNSTLTVKNCQVYGTVNGSRYHLGGLIGHILFRLSDGNQVVIDECRMEAEVTGTRSYHTGGLVGFIHSEYADNNSVIIQKCVTDSALIKTTADVGYHVGGAVGHIYSDHGNRLDIQILNCDIATEELRIEHQGAYNLGGIIGYYRVGYAEYNAMTIEGCTVSGKTISNSSTSSGTTAGTGGVIGAVKYDYLRQSSGTNGSGFNAIEVTDCDVYTGSIRGNTDNIGGLIGLYYNYKSDDSQLKINNSNVHSETVHGYSTSANTKYNRRVGGAIGWYRIEGESVASGTPTNDPLYYRAERTYLEINDCIVAAEVYTETSEGYEVGGLAGYLYAYYAPYAEIHVNRCVSKGDVRTVGAGSYRVGGLIGITNFFASSYSTFLMKDCEAYGDVTTTGYGAYKVGGVLGELLYGGAYMESLYQGVHAVVQCRTEIINCHSYANIVSATGGGAYYVGGLIGVTDVNVFSDRTRVLVENCSASPDVTSGSYYVGGLIGFCENARPNASVGRKGAASELNNSEADKNQSVSMYTTVRNCYATGNVTGGSPNNENNWGTNVGGLIGHCHAGDDLPNDAMVVENCYATGDVSISVASGYNVGGLIGRPYKNVTIKNCYATGDVYGPGLHVGGFVGFAQGYVTGDNHVTIKNCYSTGNVVGGSSGVGGFVGLAHYTYIQNCYSTGSVYHQGNIADNYTGGFIGWVTGGGRVTNCYATGHVAAARDTNNIGGFIGYRGTLAAVNPLHIENCLYDATTSKAQKGVASHSSGGSGYLYITRNEQAQSDVSGYLTTDMIHFGTFRDQYSAWLMVNNVCTVASSKHTATAAQPWYIDNDITYPYLYYQADGFSQILTTASDHKPLRVSDSSRGEGDLNNIPVNASTRNYYLTTVEYASTVNGSYTPLTGKRADYHTDTLAALNVHYRAVTAGAARVYFPYTHGNGLGNYNQYQHWFNGSQSVYIPRESLHAHVPNSLYSLGAVSETQIVAFSGGPYAAKDSDRPVWVNGQTETYTYVGQSVEYAVEIGNYSEEADWNRVFLTDPLVNGITLLEGEVYADYGAGKQQVLYWDGMGTEPSALPYYTYGRGTAGSGYEEQYILTVYLGDFAAAQLSESGLQVQTCEVTFKAWVGKAAATEFKPDGSWDGDNIRNRGTVSGDLVNLNRSSDLFEIAVDDNNTDPIYDRYMIIYNSNYDRNDTRDEEDVERIMDYVLPDGSGVHTVLPNQQPDDGSDAYLGFQLAGYEFTGWFYYEEDGGISKKVNPGEDIENIMEDRVLFAQWEWVNPAFEFFKVDPLDNYLAGAVFELYRWNGAGSPQDNELITAAGIAAQEWVKIGTYESQGNTSGDPPSPIVLDFPEDGYYQLLETTVPEEYYLLEDQWRFEVELGDPADVSDPEWISSETALLSVDFIKEDEVWMLRNYKQIELEFLKVSNFYYHSDGIYSDILPDAVFSLYIWTDPGQEPGDEELVDPDSIVAGKWKLLGECISDAGGYVHFSFLNDGGIYQLVETAAPADYQLPSGEWRFYVEAGDSLEQIVQSINAIKGSDGTMPPAFKIMDENELNGAYEGQLALVNQKKYELPELSGKGIQLYLALGALLIFIGTVWASARKSRRLYRSRRGLKEKK